MLKYNEEKKAFEFYSYRVTYRAIATNNIIEDYTDSPSDVLTMVNRTPFTFDSFTREELVPTEDQKQRLAKINALNLEYPYNYIMDFINYVKFGVMVNKSIELANLAAESKEASIGFLVDNLKPEVKAFRDIKVDSGVELFGRKFDSNDLAKTNVTGYITMGLLEKQASGKNTKIYKWKDFDNQYTDLTFDQVCQLGITIARHIEACFAAEALTLLELAKLSTEELLEYEVNSKYNREGNKTTPEVDLSTGETLITPMVFRKVVDTYEVCYQQAFAALGS